MAVDVASVEVPEERVLSIRERLDPADISRFIGSSFDELFGRITLLGAHAAGPPFVTYHAFGPKEIDIEACVPVDGLLEASGRIEAQTIPAMTVARTLHAGPYDQIGRAHLAITDWLSARDIQPIGPVRERYLVGPGDVAQATAYRTEVEIPILAIRAAVPV